MTKLPDDLELDEEHIRLAVLLQPALLFIVETLKYESQKNYRLSVEFTYLDEYLHLGTIVIESAEEEIRH